jgi:hypothetical protein
MRVLTTEQTPTISLLLFPIKYGKATFAIKKHTIKDQFRKYPRTHLEIKCPWQIGFP